MSDYLRDAIDSNMQKIGAIRESTYPTENGWLSDLRNSLGMNLDTFGKLVGVSASTVKDHEYNELSGSLSLKILQRYADALGIEFVYGFCHKGKTLEQMIDLRAEARAFEILESTYQTMDIEGEFFDKNTLKSKLEEQKYRLKQDLKNLWKD